MRDGYTENQWSEQQRKLDFEFVRDLLTSWTTSNEEIVKALDRFTPGELQSFLETFGKGPHLKSAIEAAGVSSFLERAEVWGKQYIALHSEKTRKPGDDLSLYEEYGVDLDASRM